MQQRNRAGGKLAGSVGSLVAIVLVAGCSSGGDDAASGTTTLTPSSEGTAPRGATSAAGSLTGVWEGSYECAQGATGLRLTLDPTGGDTVGAAFEFFPTGGDADAATGGFNMQGTVTDGTLTLDGKSWLQEAQGYRMVGIEAPVADRPDPEALDGNIVGSGCTTFSVRRVSSDPWYVGAWKGAYGCNQGVTGVTLTVDRSTAGEISAVFEFYAVEENPGVPSGSFNMTGTYEGGALRLQGTDWIEQPDGYLVVDYESYPRGGLHPDRLFGTVSGQGCTLFTMDRVG